MPVGGHSRVLMLPPQTASSRLQCARKYFFNDQNSSGITKKKTVFFFCVFLVNSFFSFCFCFLDFFSSLNVKEKTSSTKVTSPDPAALAVHPGAFGPRLDPRPHILTLTSSHPPSPSPSQAAIFLITLGVVLGEGDDKPSNMHV